MRYLAWLATHIYGIPSTYVTRHYSIDTREVLVFLSRTRGIRNIPCLYNCSPLVTRHERARARYSKVCYGSATTPVDSFALALALACLLPLLCGAW